jgi:hypothetical protein
MKSQSSRSFDVNYRALQRADSTHISAESRRAFLANSGKMAAGALLLPGALTPFASALADPSTAHDAVKGTTPEVKLLVDYFKFFADGSFLFDLHWDKEKLLAGLPKYVTDKTVLHEAPSVPWGGTMVGYAGFVRLCEKAAPVLASLASVIVLSDDRYYQQGNVVLHEYTATFKATPAAPEPFVMEAIGKYTVEAGRISQIEVFFADTASLLQRLKLLGVLPEAMVDLRHDRLT